MLSLATGDDLLSARNTLQMTQSDLANALGISSATLRRHETSTSLDNMVALAVECLLRRRAQKLQTPISPEERAARKFREQEHLRALRESAGMTPRGGRAHSLADQATTAAERRVAFREARMVLLRNRHRDRVRGELWELHCKARALVPAAVASGDWTAYRAAVRMPVGDVDPFLGAYMAEAFNRPIADDDPLVTLPLEPTS